MGLLLLPGCLFVDRHHLANTGQNEVLRVRNGDRYYLTLEENCTTGYSWRSVCDDEHIDVTIDHQPPETSDANSAMVCGAPGKAFVEVRVHRGFDGAATVRFVYKRDWETKPAKEFTLGLFCRTGDAAFWKK